MKLWELSASEIVAEINKKIPAGSTLIEGGTNQEAINRSTEIVIFAVPWEAHNYLLNDLKNQIGKKTLVDIVVPLSKNDPKKVSMPPEGQKKRQASPRQSTPTAL